MAKSAAMNALQQAVKPTPTAALSRLLSDSALWRAALGACGVPLMVVEALTPARPVAYVNAAFERLLGYRSGEAIGQALASLMFRGDEALVHRLLAQSSSRCEITAWAKDGSMRRLELVPGAVRSPEGRVTHWVLAFSEALRQA